MGCNDYNLHLDGSEGNDSPTPEYNIYLDGVGVNGYSPTIDIVNENTASFQIQTNDINGSELTSPIPKLDYITNNYVSNTSLASTLAGYLQIDGSNAQQDITINQAQFISLSDNSGVRIRKIGGGALQLNTTSSYLTAGGTRPLSLTGGGKSILLSDKAYYDNKQIATIDDIGNGTITLTQGGVTKGTFTTNQSGNATIDLDAGGGSITNPLQIGYTDETGTRNLNLGVDETTSKVISSFTISTGGSFFSAPIKLLTGSSNPLVLTENQDGLYNLSLNVDDTTIKVNQDGELYAVGGGGGGSYTAGTGIDITSDVISIDTDVVAQLSDIPDVSDFVTNSSLTTTLADYVLSSSLASVATSGSYADLLNKPTIPTNSDYVDLTSNQTIGGVKTFSSETHHLGVITFDSAMLNPIIRGMSGANYRNMIYRMGNDSAIIVGNSNDTIDLKGSGTRPTYNSNNLALYSDIPTNSNYVDLTTAQSVGGNKTFTGVSYLRTTYIQNSSGVNIGRIRFNDNKLAIEGTGTNRSINLIPSGTGEVQANGNKVIDETDLATTSTAGIVQPDGSTITVNNGVVKTEGVVNQQDSTTTLKYWTGTKAQYDAIVTKDSNTLYNVTDDTVNLNNVANTGLSNITIKISRYVLLYDGSITKGNTVTFNDNPVNYDYIVAIRDNMIHIGRVHDGGNKIKLTSTWSGVDSYNGGAYQQFYSMDFGDKNGNTYTVWSYGWQTAGIATVNEMSSLFKIYGVKITGGAS